MVIRLFAKPDLTSKKQLEDLNQELNKLQIRYEKLDLIYQQKKDGLNEKYAHDKRYQEEEIKSLEDINIRKRQEYDILSAPFTKRENIVALKEKEIERLFEEIKIKSQELFEKEVLLENDKKSVKGLADELGERKLELKKREAMISYKETILKDKEEQVILNIDKFNTKNTEKDQELQKKGQDLQNILILLKEKEKELENREYLLKEAQIKLNSQRQALLVAKQDAINSRN